MSKLCCYHGNQRENTVFCSWNSYYGSCGINFENVKMYSRWRLAVQSTCSIKLTKLANMWKEIEVIVKNWEGSIPQSAAIATVKTS